MATTVSKAPVLNDRAAVFKALGEPTRLRMVEFLRKHRGEATGRELAESAGISLALLCHHADALVDAGVVFKRKERQTSYWRINARLLAELRLYLVG
jgi:ArsR family transcriptional regulator, arsenate/arsenite/antimonite-responsive transcriptional repressor